MRMWRDVEIKIGVWSDLKGWIVDLEGFSDKRGRYRGI